MIHFVIFGLSTTGLAAPVPLEARGGPQSCATGPELDAHLASRGAPVPKTSGTPPRAVGGLVVLEDDGRYSVNAGSVFDLPGEALHFEPGAVPGSFSATRTSDAVLDTELGTLVQSFGASWGEQRVPLLFPFRFGAHTYTELYATSDLGLFFRSQRESTASWQLGQSDLGSSQPRITPLLRDGPWIWADIVDLYVKQTPSAVTFTWYENTTNTESNPHLDRHVQVVLHQTGAIDIVYPEHETYNTFGAVQVVADGLMGPLPVEGYLTDVSTLDGTPTTIPGVREAFALPAVDVYAIRDALLRLGLDDSNLDAIAVYQNHYTQLTLYAGAYHTRGAPGVSGIGQDGAKKTSLLQMNHIDLSWNRRSDGTQVEVLAHELGHRWLFFIDGVGFSNAGGHPSQGSHLPAPYSWWTATDSSVMGGTTWTDNADGTFTTPMEATGYSYAWLELYLMGFAAPFEVPDWYYIGGNWELYQPYWPEPDRTYSGWRNNLSISEVVAANGLRSPSWPASQQAFSMAFVLMGRPENPVTDADIANVRYKMGIFGPTWHEMVLQRGTVESELPPILGLGVPDCDFDGVDDGLEIAEGLGEDCDLNGVLDTCEGEVVLGLTATDTVLAVGDTLVAQLSVEHMGESVRTADLTVEVVDGDGGLVQSVIGPSEATLVPGAAGATEVRVEAESALAGLGDLSLEARFGSAGCAVARASLTFVVEP